MKKIVLLCVKNYDAFACAVAEEIQRLAGAEFEVTSMTTAELHRLPADVDLILFAPPRYRFLERLKNTHPRAKIAMIDMKLYAEKDGAAILKFALELLETEQEDFYEN